MGALDGIRVIDAGIIVQGPQAGQTLVDMGADVIKVEMPGLGDQARWIPSSAEDARAPYFIANNRGKRSITLDLRLPDGAEAFLKLIETADVVISNGAINLCADKQAALTEIMRILKPGCRLQFADIANGQPVPDAAVQNIDLWTA